MKIAMSLSLGVLGIALLGATVAQADYITPVGATLTGDIAIEHVQTSALIDHATSTSYAQANPGGNALGELWAAGTTAPSGGRPAAHAILTFDLGATYDVTKIYGWRYNRTADGTAFEFDSVNAYDLLGSSDGITFNQIAVVQDDPDRFPTSDGSAEYVQTRVLADMEGLTNLNAASGVRYIQMDVWANWNGYLGDGSTIGFGEVAFEGNVVPEPSSLVLLGSSLMGLLAYAWRKRK